MSNRKAPSPIDILPTADGSPTLSLSGGEMMHSSMGAFAESLYTYAPCIEKAASTGSPRILSMGFGLGYNELMALAQFLKLGITDFKILSFEKEDFLKDYWIDYLKGKTTELNSCYETIFSLMSEHFEIPESELKQFCLTSFENEKLILKGPLAIENDTDELYNGLLYDAFSNRTDDFFWLEENIQKFLKSYASKSKCYFSTYAATGNLNRALKSQGFQIEKRRGFGKKRGSTLAHRL